MSQHQWRVKPVLPVTKALGAVAVLVLTVAFGGHDPVQWVIAGVAATGLAIWALRDVVRPVRLAADPDGLTVVAGLLARRHLAWDRIERVRVERHTRRGLSTELLEIDAGDSLHLFSVHELGADPEEVAGTLNELATRSATASGPPQG